MEEKKVYILQCGRCKVKIESHTAPAHKMNLFLCNSCHLQWKEMEEKLIGHTYEDEMRKKFIDFVNGLAYLRNHTLRGN